MRAASCCATSMRRAQLVFYTDSRSPKVQQIEATRRHHRAVVAP
jgi:hypothetical protein